MQMFGEQLAVVARLRDIHIAGILDAEQGSVGMHAHPDEAVIAQLDIAAGHIARNVPVAI